MMLGQATMIRICLCLYGIHMSSIPVLLYVSIAEIRRQKSVAKLTEWEYWGVRLFLGYLLADALRGVDGMFDNPSDGTVRSVWGWMRLDLRLTAWWFRDACLFCALSLCLQYYTSWAEQVLQVAASSKRLVFILKCCACMAVAGLSVGFYLILATNRQLTQIISVSMIFPVNLASAFITARLIWYVLPEIQLRRQDLQVETARARQVSCLILSFNVIILTVMPSLCMHKLLTQPLSSPMAPNRGIDSWIGEAHLPSILDLQRESPELSPSPAMEVVEVALAWFFLMTWLHPKNNKEMKHQ